MNVARRDGGHDARVDDVQVVDAVEAAASVDRGVPAGGYSHRHRAARVVARAAGAATLGSPSPTVVRKSSSGLEKRRGGEESRARPPKVFHRVMLQSGWVFTLKSCALWIGSGSLRLEALD